MYELFDEGVGYIRGFFNRLETELIPSATASLTGRPRYDLYEQPKEYTLEMELPGMTRENVVIKLTNNDKYLVVSGEKTPEKPELLRQYLRKERKVIKFTRYVELPKDINTNKLKGKIDNGVLLMNLPKKNSIENVKTIQIDE